MERRRLWKCFHLTNCRMGWSCSWNKWTFVSWSTQAGLCLTVGIVNLMDECFCIQHVKGSIQTFHFITCTLKKTQNFSSPTLNLIRETLFSWNTGWYPAQSLWGKSEHNAPHPNWLFCAWLASVSLRWKLSGEFVPLFEHKLRCCLFSCCQNYVEVTW